MNGEYSSASITPYAPDNASDITYLNVKHIEAVVTPQLQINSTTGEWEVSYNDGQTWQPLGVAAKDADGVDGTTPQISIGADNCWQVSYDNGNTWMSLNVKALGMDGANGTNGADGRDGVDGTNGADGRDGTDGVNGRDGIDGTNGANGKNGTDGLTPHIGENGNWYIGDTDTGVAATGKNGKNGKNGVDGKDGVGISTAAIDADECLIVTFTDGSTVNAGKLPTNIQKMTKVRTLSTASAAAAGISLTGAVTSVLYLFKRKSK